jgi:hypothetical protein
VLTPLQQRLLDIVGRLPEADGFALAGGAALILRGTVARPGFRTSRTAFSGIYVAGL